MSEKRKSIEVEFDLSEEPYCFTGDGTKIEKFVLRAIGKDHEDAADKLVGANKADRGEMLMCLSVVSVNGKAVEAPYDGFAGWTEMARTALGEAFASLNIMTKERAKSFLSKARPL